MFLRDYEKSFISQLQIRIAESPEVTSLEASQRAEATAHLTFRMLDDSRRRAGEFFCALTHFCYSMRLATTEDRIVRMVPTETELGDVVMFIKDVDAPLILRKCIGTGNFRVVGTAFSHGFMCGERLLLELAAQCEWENVVLSRSI